MVRITVPSCTGTLLSFETGSLTFFYVSTRRHLITHSLRILPHTPAPYKEATSKTASSVNLPLQLPNPFKGLKHRLGQTAPTVTIVEELGRIELAEAIDTDVTLPAGSPLRIDISSVARNLNMSAWSEQELVVRSYQMKQCGV